VWLYAGKVENFSEQAKELINGHEVFISPVVRLELQYLFEGVREILSKLKEKGVICVLLTNANEKQNQFLLEKFGIKKYFDLIVDDSSGLAEKPNPARVNFILEKFSINSQETLIVDDSIAGLLAGKNAKTKTCGVLTGNSTKEMFKKEEVDYIFESVKELEKLFG
jgi:HAD superfamily hydrolase (TIGR01509 family)